MLDISEDPLGVSFIQINTIAGRQVLLVKITIARPCLRGNEYDVSQDVWHLVAGRRQTRDFDLLFARLSVPDECMTVGRRRPGTKINVIGTFGRSSSNGLYTRCSRLGVRRNSSHTLSMLGRHFRESLRLLMVGARRQLLCATAPSPQAHGGRKHRDPCKKLQTRIFPNHPCHLRILVDPKSNATVGPPQRTPPGHGWIFRSALGHYRCWCRDRVFANRALADGIFAKGIFAYRRGNRLRLRSWQVGSDCCSHESERGDTEDHKFQHRKLQCESR